MKYLIKSLSDAVKGVTGSALSATVCRHVPGVFAMVAGFSVAAVAQQAMEVSHSGLINSAAVAFNAVK
jgi:hypothetical protein